MAVCFLDLDEFKPVNDNFGHIVGDKLLVDLAQRIKNTLRNEDTVCRLGGDEFVILFVDAKSDKEFEQIACRLLDSCSKPYLIDNHKIEISLSIGISIAHSLTDDLPSLLNQADIAMYKVKQSGRNGYHFFNKESDSEV